MSITTDTDAAAGIFDPTTSPVTFKPDNHPVEYYMSVDRSFRGDLLLNNHEVVGFLNILEENVTKHFLSKRIADFDKNIRTIVSVSGTCLKNTSTKALETQFLSDYLHFVVSTYHFLFSDTKVVAFLVDPENIQGNPLLPRNLEKDRANALMMSVPWILPLAKGTAIVEGPITSDKVLESLESYHSVTGEWDLLMEMGNVVGSLHLDERQTFPRPKAKCNSNQKLSMEVLVRNEDHPSVKYACIRQSIRYVQTENERVYALANPTFTSIPNNIIVTSGVWSVKSASVASSVVVQVNERMILFKSLLFAFPAVDVSCKLTNLTLGSITDKVKDLFASATSASDQARLASLAMVNLAGDVSKETSYLSRTVMFPQLS